MERNQATRRNDPSLFVLSPLGYQRLSRAKETFRFLQSADAQANVVSFLSACQEEIEMVLQEVQPFDLKKYPAAGRVFPTPAMDES